MVKFKIGDIIQLGDNYSSNWRGIPVTVIKTLGDGEYEIKKESGEECMHREDGTSRLIKSNKIMDIKEKFVLAITPEPQKSFRNAGITNGDNILTDDGANVFLSWLLEKLEKNANAFKSEVVDAILKDQDKE